MGNRDIQTDELDHYLEENSSSESALLEEIRLATFEKSSQPHMLSGHVQGRYLSLISQLLSPKKILEIGTFTGYATLCLSEGLATEGTITTLELDSKLADFYQPYFDRSNFKDQIKPIITDAVVYLEENKEEWELVFLDANKKKYITYFDLLIPMMPSGGVILADNVLWKGKVLDSEFKDDPMTKALMDFNQHVKQDDRVEVVILPLRDGISLIRKK